MIWLKNRSEAPDKVLSVPSRYLLTRLRRSELSKSVTSSWQTSRLLCEPTTCVTPRTSALAVVLWSDIDLYFSSRSVRSRQPQKSATLSTPRKITACFKDQRKGGGFAGPLQRRTGTPHSALSHILPARGQVPLRTILPGISPPHSNPCQPLPQSPTTTLFPTQP